MRLLWPRPKPRREWPERNGITLWRRSKTGHGSIGIEPPCTGSPNCAGGLHIETAERDGRKSQWLTVHLTDDEIRWAIERLTDCLDYYARGETPGWG